MFDIMLKLQMLQQPQLFQKYPGKINIPMTKVDNEIILPINTNLLFSLAKNLEIYR